MLLAGGLAVFTWRSAVFARDLDDGAHRILLPLLAAGLMTLALSVIATIGFLVAKAAGARSSWQPPASASLVAALLGVVAATPVTWRWEDGCNAHTATLPLASMPLTMATRPERPFAYEDEQTLVACPRWAGPSPAQ